MQDNYLKNPKAECVLIVGGGLLQVPAIEIAQKMGLVAAVTDKDPEAPGIRIADEPKTINIYDIKSHLKFVDELKKKYVLKGVFTEGADVEVTVAESAFYAGLPGISPQAARNCKSKVLMRKCFEKAGIPNPRWAEVKSLREAIRTAENNIGFPLIFKAVDNCASRGSTRVFDKKEIPSAWQMAMESSTTKSALLEGLYRGKEQSTEIIFDGKGKCYHLNIVDRPFSSGKWAMELGHINPSALPNTKKETLFRLAEKAAKACGVNFGAFKIDTIWTKDGPRILEVTARLSGGFDCQYTTPLATGRNFIKAALDLAISNEIDKGDLTPKWHKYAVAWAAFPPPGEVVSIAGIEDALAVPGVRHVFLRVKPGDVIRSYLDCAARPAFIIAVGNSKEEAMEQAQKGAKSLKIETRRVRGENL